MMTKDDIISRVAEKSDITKKAATAAVKTFLDAIIESVSAGEKVQFVGFGTFQASKRAARNGKNPLTGKTIKIPEKTVPTFRAGKAFKEATAAGSKKKN